MSLFSLLNLGSAMPKVKAMGRYNLAKQHMLPTFGSSKNPQPISANEVAAQPAVTIAAMPVAVKPLATAPVTVKKATSGLGWLKKSNPFTDAQPGGMKTDKPAQPELSLDKVKVVRNDLSEADIEVVPKAPPGSTIPAKRYVRPEVQPDKLGKKAWGLLGSRLFGAAATKH